MRRVLRYLLIAIVAIVVVAGIALATPFGRGIVVSQIQKGAAGAGLVVSIEGASGWPPFTLGAARITIADADGVFAEIDNLAVDIKTTALLVGSISFDSLAADRIMVARAPHVAGGGGGGAALPFAANSVSVARLELGAELARRPAVLTLTGALVSGAGGRLAGEVHANRIDGRTGTLSATFDRANGSAPIAADIELAEDADGILSGIIGRASGPGYRLAAKSAVTGDTVAGSLSLSSNGAARFAGDFSLAPLADGGTHVVAKGAGDFAELVPPEYADLLSGAIALAVDADWTPAPGRLPAIAVRQGTLSTGNVHAEVSGTFSDAVADLAVKMDAAKAGGGTLNVPFTNPPSRIENLAMTGKVAPSGDRIRMELIGRATGLATGAVTIPGLGLSLAVEAPKANPLAAGELPFAARIEADAVQTATGRIESVGGSPVILDAEGTFETATSIAKTNAKLGIAGGTATFTGTLSAEGAKGDVTAAFADLRPLAPLAGRAIAGSLSAKASGTFAAESAFNVTATATDLDPVEATLAKLMRGQTQIAATLGAKADGFTIDDLTIAGGALNASGKFALANGTVVGTAKGGIADLALVADQSSGAAVFDATVSGAIARPVVNGTVTVASGTLLGQSVENATVQINSATSDAGWLAALTLSGGFAGKPLTGKASATLDALGSLAFPRRRSRHRRQPHHRLGDADGRRTILRHARSERAEPCDARGAGARTGGGQRRGADRICGRRRAAIAGGDFHRRRRQLPDHRGRQDFRRRPHRRRLRYAAGHRQRHGNGAQHRRLSHRRSERHCQRRGWCDALQRDGARSRP